MSDFAHVEWQGKRVRIEHAFMEPESCLVVPETSPTEGRRYHLYSQGQGVFDDQRAVAKVLGIGLDRVHVELVAAGATMGDIIERLKKLWGTYRENPVF